MSPVVLGILLGGSWYQAATNFTRAYVGSLCTIRSFVSLLSTRHTPRYKQYIAIINEIIDEIIDTMSVFHTIVRVRACNQSIIITILPHASILDVKLILQYFAKWRKHFIDYIFNAARQYIVFTESWHCCLHYSTVPAGPGPFGVCVCVYILYNLIALFLICTELKIFQTCWLEVSCNS